MCDDIYDMKWLIGAHTTFSSNDDLPVYSSLQRSINYGMYATQFFLGGKQRKRRYRPTKEDIDMSLQLVKRFPMYVFTHYSLITNLAGRKDCLAWNGDSAIDNDTDYVISELENELDVLSAFPNNGVVIHPGNHIDRNKGLHAIAKSINKINFSPNSNLLLENSAGQGTSLATTLSELKTIYDNVEDSKKKYISICLDTCHLYAYGDYNLSEVKEVERLFNDVDELFGVEKIKLFHLNDSKKPLKSRVDRHAQLGFGHIWGNDDYTSLLYLLNRCNEHNIPLVLETHGIDMLFLSQLSDKI